MFSPQRSTGGFKENIFWNPVESFPVIIVYLLRIVCNACLLAGVSLIMPYCVSYRTVLFRVTEPVHVGYQIWVHFILQWYAFNGYFKLTATPMIQYLAYSTPHVQYSKIGIHCTICSTVLKHPRCVVHSDNFQRSKHSGSHTKTLLPNLMEQSWSILVD